MVCIATLPNGNRWLTGACKFVANSVKRAQTGFSLRIIKEELLLKHLLNVIMILCLALSAWTPFAAATQRRNNSNAFFSFNAAPYRVGEHLTYNVSFSNFINAAHVEIFVVGRGQFFNRDALQLRAHVETTEVVGVALFALNNDYITYVDPASGIPFRTQQIKRDAARDAVATPEDANLPAGTNAIPAQSAIESFPTTYDFLAGIYRMRALPLTDGSVYSLIAQQGDQNYATEIKVIGRQLVKTNVGSFNTVVTQLRVLRNAEANSYRARIYFSDDERHVPVLITAQHPSGEIRAELASAELPAKPATPNILPGNNVAQAPAKIVPPANNTLGTRMPVNAESALPLNLPFEIGEQLNYNVFLGAASAAVGTASFQVRARQKYFNRDGILLTGQAGTNALAQRIFFANDQINSYVDPTTLLPFRTQLALREGRRSVNEIITFDQDRGNATTDKGTRIDIPVGTHDILSVLYALRSFDLTPPKRSAVSFIVNDRPRTFFVTAQRRETIQLNNRSIEAVQLSLTTDDPQPDKYSLRLWVSTDRRRLPLRATAVTQLGLVRADLAIIPVMQQ
jgi:hypothetical protein